MSVISLLGNHTCNLPELHLVFVLCLFFVCVCVRACACVHCIAEPVGVTEGMVSPAMAEYWCQLEVTEDQRPRTAVVLKRFHVKAH